MGNKIKPWHSQHRHPKHKGKAPRHKRVLGYHEEHEEISDSVWLNLPPTKDELADGAKTDPS